MKVVIVTSFPFPNGKATANRISGFAEQLRKKDDTTEVIIVPCSDLPGVFCYIRKESISLTFNRVP